jgi:hypothetical protein
MLVFVFVFVLVLVRMVMPMAMRMAVTMDRVRGRASGAGLVLVPMSIAMPAIDHRYVSGGDGVLLDAAGTQLPSGEAQALQAAAQLCLLHAGREERPEGHIATDAGEAIEVGDPYRRRALTLAGLGRLRSGVGLVAVGAHGLSFGHQRIWGTLR